MNRSHNKEDHIETLQRLKDEGLFPKTDESQVSLTDDQFRAEVRLRLIEASYRHDREPGQLIDNAKVLEQYIFNG